MKAGLIRPRVELRMFCNATGSSPVAQEHSTPWPASLSIWELGAGDGDRTRDIQLGKLAFYR